MPTVFREQGIRFFFYSNEGSPREPLHIHAVRGDCECKIMIDPVPRIVRSSIFRAAELRDILRIINAHRVLIERAWHDHFGD